MGDPRGFVKNTQRVPEARNPIERLGDWNEHYMYFDEEQRRKQASRCMDCGVPFCMSGCPLGNLIPDFNDLVYKGQWKEALRTLHATNNFPEYTGKICPAPCENSCVLGIIEPSVTIRNDESSIVEKGFQEGWIVAQTPKERTDKKIAIVGGGPAGLACAQQLNRAGHNVTIFEKRSKLGGLMQWGIPAYKIRKEVVQRRISILKQEGIDFTLNCEIGKDVTWADLKKDYDALVVAIGAEQPRDLPAAGRDAKGVHFAVDFLAQNIARIYGEKEATEGEQIKAAGKNVIVIGGGDTGSDCIGTSLRQGAKSVVSFELMPKPPQERAEHNPWPQYARVFKESSSMEENRNSGGQVEYCIATKEVLKDEKGNVKGLKTVRVEWSTDDHGRPTFDEVPGSEETWDAELILLAMGFTGPVIQGMVDELGVELDLRGNLKTDDASKMTNLEGVFAAGDCRRGQSLVVWAIAEGREIASNVDTWLMKKASLLPRVRLTPYRY
ncbi:MAG: glutamate synthase subunit beta [Planctomycetes bacterium]|nr:glutamate synthase subunit beta [Planctomycetota bacterium]